MRVKSDETVSEMMVCDGPVPSALLEPAGSDNAERAPLLRTVEIKSREISSP